MVCLSLHLWFLDELPLVTEKRLPYQLNRLSCTTLALPRYGAGKYNDSLGNVDGVELSIANSGKWRYGSLLILLHLNVLQDT